MSGIPIPWTFKTWLDKFKDVNLPIGDLARDVLNDSDFPNSEKYKVLYDYLVSKRADYIVLETFDTVWKFYLASR